MRKALIATTIAMAFSVASVRVVDAREISFWGHDFEVNDAPVAQNLGPAAPSNFKAEVDHSERRPSRMQRKRDER